MNYSIRQVAEKTNLTPHTLRYYDKEGLLPFLSRSENGIRKFSESDLEWLGLICCLKNTGMSIREIKVFVELSLQGDETLKARCDMLLQHKRSVEEQIRTMEIHLQKVTYKIEHFNAKYREYLKRARK